MREFRECAEVKLVDTRSIGSSSDCSASHLGHIQRLKRRTRWAFRLMAGQRLGDVVVGQERAGTVYRELQSIICEQLHAESVVRDLLGKGHADGHPYRGI